MKSHHRPAATLFSTECHGSRNEKCSHPAQKLLSPIFGLHVHVRTNKSQVNLQDQVCHVAEIWLQDAAAPHVNCLRHSVELWWRPGWSQTLSMSTFNTRSTHLWSSAADTAECSSPASLNTGCARCSYWRILQLLTTNHSGLIPAFQERLNLLSLVCCSNQGSVLSCIVLQCMLG